MATPLSHGNSHAWAAESAPSDGHAAAESESENALLAKDSLTGLPWTEALLPLVKNWAGTSTVHVLCLHFVGLGLLANLQEFQSTPSLLYTAAERLGPLMGDDDRLSRFSGNKLLLFSKRSESAVRALLAAAAEQLSSLGAEVNGQHVPGIRVGMAVLEWHEAGPVTGEALNALISKAAGETYPLTDLAAARREAAAPAGRPAAVDVSDQHTKTGGEMEATMIIRGHPERTAIRPMEESPAPRAVPKAIPSSEHRLILKAVDVHVTGLVATALIDLDFEGRRVRGKAIGRSSEQYHVGLVGEAMTRAVTDLLPAGHGAVFRQAVPISTEFGEALVTVVEFLTPESNEFLFGVSPVEGEALVGVAKSILSAVNHRTARLLDAAE